MPMAPVLRFRRNDIYAYGHGHHELCLRAILNSLLNMDIRTARRLFVSDGGGSFPT